MDDLDPVRRLCVAVEADSSEGEPEGEDAATSRTGDAHPSGPLVDLAERASMAAGLDQVAFQVQPAGVLLVLNSGVNEPRVVVDLTRELHNGLWRRNRRQAGTRLRCRVAFHQGLVRLTDEGFEGQAVTVVGDLCASEHLRAELGASPRSDLAMIISGQLLDELAYPESADLHRRQFRPVTVTLTAARSMPAYVYALGG
ncbi:hypothetical protein GCM10023194_37050 [Planotetraspora phitsanulokensis]|uniref:Uncharacterized protein n=1 Tax=Planotetraspora phitsanulokensis TaxID=575192 RepID=A0A8J3XH44_9ACTN|nr:hypothetical protein [Planotetraspora phitsanulokensis]GII36168.1 hypothetical protein Pph01_11710 [Planotetraspora phitsanulokensis]